jgi:hypothetical protein
VFVHKTLSGMVCSVSGVLLGNFMPATVATALKVPFSTVLNAPLEPVIDASASPTPTGTERTAFVSLAFLTVVNPASAMGSSSATIVKDAPQNPIPHGPTASASVTMVTST